MLFRIEFIPEISCYYCYVSSGQGCSGHFKKLQGINDAFVLQQLLLGCEDPLVVVKMPLKKVLGVRVSPSSWVFCSEEVQGAVGFVGLQVRRPGFESRL